MSGIISYVRLRSNILGALKLRDNVYGTDKPMLTEESVKNVTSSGLALICT